MPVPLSAGGDLPPSRGFLLSHAPPPFRTASRAGLFGWVMFDWACQPFFTLVTTFVFAPYFAARLAPNPAEGQALWGYATAAAGLTIALFSPALGAVADETGRRKPWIALFGILMALASLPLWWATPGNTAMILPVLVAFALATIGAEFAAVFNNAMMPRLVPPERLGRLSGLGWAMGYVGGLISLVLTLGFLAGSPETGKTFFGLTPLFGLDAASNAGDRIVGPLTALWFAVFALPMFLFTPDQPATGVPMKQAFADGLASLLRTFAEVRRNANAIRFFLANMLYTDALAALFAFGGIYAAGTFGWSAIEIGVFGILLTITGTVGALVGGRLDDAIGARTVVAGALVVLIMAALGIVSIGPDRIGFVVAVAPPAPGDGLYASLSEQCYLALGGLIGLAAGPMQAASRSLLARIAPPEHIGQYYGLFALSGKVTSFLGPLLVALVTDLSGSQKAGVSVLLLFFGAGLWLLSGVAVRRTA